MTPERAQGAGAAGWARWVRGDPAPRCFVFPAQGPQAAPSHQTLPARSNSHESCRGTEGEGTAWHGTSFGCFSSAPTTSFLLLGVSVIESVVTSGENWRRRKGTAGAQTVNAPSCFSWEGGSLPGASPFRNSPPPPPPGSSPQPPPSSPFQVLTLGVGLDFRQLRGGGAGINS